MAWSASVAVASAHKKSARRRGATDRGGLASSPERGGDMTMAAGDGSRDGLGVAKRRARRGRMQTLLLASSALIAAALPAAAQDATWNLNGTGDYNTGANWTPNTVPTGTASFGTSNQNNVSFSSAFSSVGGWTLNAGASNYTFTIGNAQVVQFTGAGIVVNGGSAAITDDGSLQFVNSSTAGSATITISSNFFGGLLEFRNSSTAGNAVITNNANLNFFNTSTAGNATITNNETLSFNSSSTAGNAIITNDNLMVFHNSSTAGSAVITNNDLLFFVDSSTAGNAIITNNNNAVSFGGSSSAGSATITNNVLLEFFANSTASSATITTNGGANTAFLQSASGGTARFIFNGGGVLDISGLATAGTTAGSIEGAGAIFLGSKNLAVGGNNLSTTFSGVLQDGGGFGGIGGSLTKEGTGTLTLTGANTYSGGTTVTGGVLEAAHATAGTIDALGTGDMTMNGGKLRTTVSGTYDNNLIFNNNTSSTVSAAAGQTVTFGPNGGSSFITLGTNSTAIFGSPTDTGTIVVASGFTNIDASAQVVVAGGTLRDGNGQLGVVLSSIQSTTVKAGATLDMNDSPQNAIVNLSGDGRVLIGVNPASTLLLQSGNPSTGAPGSNLFAGVIAGAGGVEVGPFNIPNSGKTILTGTNTYTGGTRIEGNTTLQLGDGGTTGSIIGNVVFLTPDPGAPTPGQLIFNRSNTYTFDGIISGPGSVQQNGGGTTVLTATSSYTGATTVNAGTLIVNGSIASSSGLTVNAGGTIGGAGILPSTTINGGTLSPGNSIGTLTVQGNLAFTSAAAYLVEVAPTQADRTNVTGTANLSGGSVQTVFAPGSYASRSYDILHAAGGLGGTTFSGTSASTPNFRVSLSYTTTDVFLNLTGALGVGAALNQNQQNVANAINGFFNNGGTLPPNFANLFFLTGGNLGNALTLISGEAATGAQQGAFMLGNQFLNVMLDPFVDGRAGVGGASSGAIGFAPERPEIPDDIALAYSKVMKAPLYKAPPLIYEPRWTAWGAAYGGTNKTSGDPLVVGSHDLTARAGGVAAGLDYRVAAETFVGFALAGGGTNWTLAQGLGGGRSDAFQAGVYGATRAGPAYVAAALAFANHWMSTDRFAAFGDHLTASFNAQSFGARVESGWRFASAFSAFTPYGALQAQSFRTPTYSEVDVTAGGFGLTYNNRTATDTRSELGARFDKQFLIDRGAVLALRSRLAWAHDWVSDPTLAAVFQALPGASFIVNGATPAKNSALASAGAELRLANGVAFIGKFDGEFASHAQTYAGTGTLRVSW
jgi:autotransporter-associated beta strand protein